MCNTMDWFLARGVSDEKVATACGFLFFMDEQMQQQFGMFSAGPY